MGAAPASSARGTSPSAHNQLVRMPSGQRPYNSLADAAVTVTAPPAPVRAPELPTVAAVLWDARLSCGERLNLNDGKLYNVKFTMEVRDRSVSLRRQTETGVELMSGEIYNGVLALTGIGYMINEPKRRWDYSLRGDLPAAAMTYLAKGAMLTRGKVTRECQLSVVRVPAAKTVTAGVTATAAPKTALPEPAVPSL